jgi:hypothetical protein
MRTFPTLLVMALLAAVSAPALAGNLVLAGEKAKWSSTGCTEPTMPASLIGADRETRASDMNTLMESYNQYATKMQEYMDCVSKEAESDSESAGKAITQAAQEKIESAQKKVSELHDALQTKN